MNRGKEKHQQKNASRAYSVRRAPGASSRCDQELSAAKDTGKPKQLLKKLSKDLSDFSLIRTKMTEEKTNDQHLKDLTQATKRSDRSVSCSKPKVKVRGKTAKDESGEKTKLDKPRSSAGVKGETPKDETWEMMNADESVSDELLSDVAAEDKTEVKPRISNSFEDWLKAKFTSSIRDYIMSPTFKRQLSECIMEEISVQIAKAMSQSPEPRRSMRFGTAESPTKGCLEEGTSKPGFSLAVASLLCYELIETRDKIIEYFQSKSAELSISSNTEIEMVKNVFKSIFASLINVETPHPDVETLSPDSLIDSFASHIFSGACESIFPRINSKDSQSSRHEATVSTDGTQTAFTPARKSGVDLESCQASLSMDVTAEGVSPSDQVSNLEDAAADYVKSLLEGIIETGIDLSAVNEPTEKVDHKSGSDEGAEKGLLAESDFRVMFGVENRFQIRATFIPKRIVKKLKSLLTSKTLRQDQSSEPEVKSKDENDDEEEDEDESILAAFFLPPQTSEQDLKPDEEAEEHLVADAGVDLDQAVTPEEKILSEVDEQDLQPSEHQELASPVPSPLASEKPDTPRESPKRTTCLPEQTSYSPDLPVSIPKTSDTETTAISQKEEEDLQHTLPLSDMENTTSLDSAENTEIREMLLTDSTNFNLLTTEAPDQDQSSGPEDQGKDKDEGEKEEEEEESILPASESISDLHDPLTSRVETSDSDMNKSVPEGVTKTSGEVSNLKKAVEEAATHFVASLPESPVPSTPFSEMPDSPQDDMSSCGRTCPPSKASSLTNVYLSIPDTETDTETTAIIQKEEDVLNPTLTLEKTANLESAENQEVKEMLLTESKEISLPLSQPLDQDWSSGPDFNSKDEDMGEDESILDNFIPPHQTSAIEPDLNPDEEAEEQQQLVDESDDPDQVLASLSEDNVSCEATEQDPQATGHEERASPVPSPQSSEEPAPTKEPATEMMHSLQTKMLAFTECCISCDCDCQKEDL